MDHLTWKKSTRSGPNGGDCIEVATDDASVYIRDSKNLDGTMLTVSAESWTLFVIHLGNETTISS